MKYLLSIITINKNNCNGLEKTCLSVVSQTYKKFEWLIIDGASDDGSIKVIKKHSAYISYSVSEKDSGIYNAMNKGISRATGEYLLFLNSGDFLLHPWTLNDVIEEIKTSEEADVYYSDCVCDTYLLIKKPKKIDLDFFAVDNINHQNCLIKRELFKHRMYDETSPIIADWLFFITELIEHNISFFHLNTNIAMYDTTGDSVKNIKEVYKRMRDALFNLNIPGKRLYHKNKFIMFLVKFKNILPYGFYKLLEGDYNFKEKFFYRFIFGKKNN